MRSVLLFVLLAGCAAAPDAARRSLSLPARRADARTGAALCAALEGASLVGRERVLAEEFAAGNVPVSLRTLVPIAVEAAVQGTVHTAVFWCTPDYLGFGADGDWLRMPMTPTLAQRLADQVDCVLPTARMVDAIWAAAPVQLAPFPFSPKEHDILALELFLRHHAQIESQRRGDVPWQLVAGIKKDVVVSPLIASFPGRVCIYGWHRKDGAPIQPLSKVHTFPHVDYSHGIRLVARTMEVDGVATTVDAVLADPQLHVLLSGEGPFASWRYPVDGVAVR